MPKLKKLNPRDKVKIMIHGKKVERMVVSEDEEKEIVTLVDYGNETQFEAGEDVPQFQVPKSAVEDDRNYHYFPYTATKNLIGKVVVIDKETNDTHMITGQSNEGVTIDSIPYDYEDLMNYEFSNGDKCANRRLVKDDTS